MSSFNKNLKVINLSGNPLTTFPTILHTANLAQLYLEHTRVEAIPEPILDWWKNRPRLTFGQYVLSLYGSPIDGTCWLSTDRWKLEVLHRRVRKYVRH